MTHVRWRAILALALTAFAGLGLFEILVTARRWPEFSMGMLWALWVPAIWIAAAGPSARQVLSYFGFTLALIAAVLLPARIGGDATPASLLTVTGFAVATIVWLEIDGLGWPVRLALCFSSGAIAVWGFLGDASFGLALAPLVLASLAWMAERGAFGFTAVAVVLFVIGLTVWP